ncbi:sensor histidine kinase [Dactylosporangium sp. NPDC000521]|uniref:sensor histidine kinase n=1 Tax=Dactylosporangium sp. NPDC000521 TaxID=3363975 RepID=UPI0036744619
MIAVHPPAAAADGVDPGQHEWYRLAGRWHVAFGVLDLLAAGLVAVDGELGAGRRMLGVALLAALAGWYAAVGAKRLRLPRSTGGWRYVAMAGGLATAAFAAAPPAGALLFVLFPHVWAMLPTRHAVAATAGIVVALSGVLAARSGAAAGELPDVVVPMLLAGVGAVGVGLWITRIIDQSKERARLVAELAATRAELAEVSRRTGALAERERMARDIHDTVAQGFTSVLLLLDALEAELTDGQDAARGYLHRARDTARENLAEARSLVAAAAPPPLVAASLPGALRQVVDRIGPDLPGGATLAVGGEPRALPPDLEVVALRVGQEALANVRRHAAANRVEVRLEYTADGLTLRVSDDGRGFDASARPDGHGLSGLRDRVTAAGGTVDVRSAPGAGVTVVVELPCAF